VLAQTIDPAWEVNVGVGKAFTVTDVVAVVLQLLALVTV
jgi:hypothetical protein